MKYLVFVTDPSVPVFGNRCMELQPEVGPWTLHAWVGLENDAGVFDPPKSKLP